MDISHALNMLRKEYFSLSIMLVLFSILHKLKFIHKNFGQNVVKLRRGQAFDSFTCHTVSFHVAEPEQCISMSNLLVWVYTFLFVYIIIYSLMTFAYIGFQFQHISHISGLPRCKNL